VGDAVQIGVCVLLSIAAVVPLLVVWRDDHRPNPHLARPVERLLESGHPLGGS
jgi:hypothetical protein